jgi:apolipoprotein N-acyltransferase
MAFEALGLSKSGNGSGKLHGWRGACDLYPYRCACYEAIFPDQLVDAKHRPAWLINVTNDGWFGNSTGPYQHLAQLRLRAIEQGLPIVRAANTGVSAVVDPYGRYVAQLAVGKDGLIDSELPQNLAPTTFAKVGRMPVFLLLILLCGIGYLLHLQSRIEKSANS